MSSDGTVIARVAAITGGYTNLAGIDLRETLDSGATHVFACFYPNYGLEYYRSTTGGANSSQTGGYVTATPYWVA